MAVKKWCFSSLVFCGSLIWLSIIDVEWSYAEPPVRNVMVASEVREGAWAHGVNADQRKQAERHFLKGNQLLVASQDLKAAESYRKALQHWEHPAIYFNLSVALTYLDRPVERFLALERAVAHGEEPLNSAIYQLAKRAQELIQKEVVVVDVGCDEQEATVTVDGRELFVAPGRRVVPLRVGRHVFSADKEGYLVNAKERALTPGQQSPIDLHLFSPRDLQRRSSRWVKWKPWAVVGGAAVLGVTGMTLNLLSQYEFGRYDTQIREACPDPSMPCTQEQFRALRERAELEQKLALGAYGLAGATAVAGLVVILNRTRVHRLTPAQAEEQMTVVPTLASGASGVAARIVF